MAKEGDKIILDNQGVVKATPTKRKGGVKDQDYHYIGHHDVNIKRLPVRLAPGHGGLSQPATYQDYKDIQGTNESNTLANMGDNLLMETPPPEPHDIVLHSQIMPTLAKTWIMQLHRQKLTAKVHWVSWVPMKHYTRHA